MVGERTRDQRDAEGRECAIDLTGGTMETPRKRSRADDVETRVAKARSLCASEKATLETALHALEKEGEAGPSGVKAEA